MTSSKKEQKRIINQIQDGGCTWWSGSVKKKIKSSPVITKNKILLDLIMSMDVEKRGGGGGGEIGSMSRQNDLPLRPRVGANEFRSEGEWGIFLWPWTRERERVLICSNDVSHSTAKCSFLLFWKRWCFPFNRRQIESDKSDRLQSFHFLCLPVSVNE